MGKEIEKPEGFEWEYLDYLDELRLSGVTNMFGASSYLEKEFALDSKSARVILSYWMKTFAERHDC